MPTLHISLLCRSIALGALSITSVNATVVVKSGGISAILTAMSAHPLEKSMQRCGILSLDSILDRCHAAKVELRGERAQSVFRTAKANFSTADVCGEVDAFNAKLQRLR